MQIIRLAHPVARRVHSSSYVCKYGRSTGNGGGGKEAKGRSYRYGGSAKVHKDSKIPDHKVLCHGFCLFVSSTVTYARNIIIIIITISFILAFINEFFLLLIVIMPGCITADASSLLRV